MNIDIHAPFKCEDWRSGKVIILNGNFFLNPFPDQQNIDFQAIRCYPVLQQVFPECGEEEKIAKEQLLIRHENAQKKYTRLVNMFCSQFNAEKNKFFFAKQSLRQWHNFLNGNNAIPDSDFFKYKIGKLELSGKTVREIREIYKEQHTCGGLPCCNIQPPGSPFYSENENDIYAEVEAYCKFYHWLKSLDERYKNGYAQIHHKASFQSENPSVTDYLNFLTCYYTEDLYQEVHNAFDYILKDVELTIENNSEPQFHHVIISRKIERLLRKLQYEFDGNSDQNFRVSLISRSFAKLRKILIKSRNRILIAVDDKTYNEIFDRKSGIYALLENLIQKIEEDYDEFIDKRQVITHDITRFELSVLKRFQTAHDQLIKHKKSGKKSKIRRCEDEINQMSAEFYEAFEYSYEVFVEIWIASFKLALKKPIEQQFLNMVLKTLVKTYISFDPAHVFTVKCKNNSFSFETEFYKEHLLMLFLKIKNFLVERQHLIANLDELNTPDSINPKEQKIEQAEKKGLKKEKDSTGLRLNAVPPSFTLRANNLKPREIIQRMDDFCDKMQKANPPFIDTKTRKPNFRKIFSGKPFQFPVRWLGNLNEAHTFIDIIHNEIPVVESIAPYHWKVAEACLVDKEGNKFASGKIKSNKGKPTKARLKLLLQWVKELLPPAA